MIQGSFAGLKGGEKPRAKKDERTALFFFLHFINIYIYIYIYINNS